eukprot:1545993-Prymnesium_polylepis.1
MAGATLHQPWRGFPAGLRADLCGHPRGNVVKRLFPGVGPRASNFSACGRADVPTLARSQCLLSDRASKLPGYCWKQLRMCMLHGVLVVVCDRPRALPMQLLELACQLAQPGCGCMLVVDHRAGVCALPRRPKSASPLGGVRPT